MRKGLILTALNWSFFRAKNPVSGISLIQLDRLLLSKLKVKKVIQEFRLLWCQGEIVCSLATRGHSLLAQPDVKGKSNEINGLNPDNSSILLIFWLLPCSDHPSVLYVLAFFHTWHGSLSLLSSLPTSSFFAPPTFNRPTYKHSINILSFLLSCFIISFVWILSMLEL